ncbi:MAG TPA: hypothetical protein VIN08_18730 [Ohtaekwangia sp.]|uniref:hypothetical protein n=1 Tax=Ohtaekwangia sp. TaxID=2066019 RepID=UPI002F92F9C5
MKKRFQILGKLLGLAAVIILIAWCVISLIANLTIRTLAEQLTMPIQLSVIGYGFAVFVIFTISFVGTLVNRRRKQDENFFGFLYFMVFSTALIIFYLTAFYREIIR